MFGRLFVKDKKEEEAEKKATRAPEEYGLAVLGKRDVKTRLDELDQIQWSDKDKPGQQTGAIAHFSSLMKVAYGLARAGIATTEAVNSLAWFYARLQGAIEGGDDVKPLQDALEFEMRRFFTLYTSVSFLPEDISKDIAVILYQGKPGQNMEGQKLLE